MKNSFSLVNFIKNFEGKVLHSYQDSAGVWTIGFGSIKWLDGTAVKEGMTCTEDQAEMLLMNELAEKSKAVDFMTQSAALTQNQFDALADFAYNCGIGALSTSTLLRKVLANASDPSIAAEFLKWDKIHLDGVLTELQGLKLRRQAESDLYFT